MSLSSIYYYRRRSTSKERKVTDRTPVHQAEVLKKCSLEHPFTIRERLQNLEQQMFENNKRLETVTHLSTILDLKYTGFVHKLNTHIKTRKRLVEIIKREKKRKQIKGSVDPVSSPQPSTSYNISNKEIETKIHENIDTKPTRSARYDRIIIKETEKSKNVPSSETGAIVNDSKKKPPESQTQEDLEKSVNETDEDKKHVFDENIIEITQASVIPHIEVSTNDESYTSLNAENIIPDNVQNVLGLQELVDRVIPSEYEIIITDISNILENDSIKRLLELSVEDIKTYDASTNVIVTVQDSRQELENKSDEFASKSEKKREMESQNKEDAKTSKKIGKLHHNAPFGCSSNKVSDKALPTVDETCHINVAANTESGIAKEEVESNIPKEVSDIKTEEIKVLEAYIPKQEFKVVDIKTEQFKVAESSICKEELDISEESKDEKSDFVKGMLSQTLMKIYETSTAITTPSTVSPKVEFKVSESDIHTEVLESNVKTDELKIIESDIRKEILEADKLNKEELKADIPKEVEKCFSTGAPFTKVNKNTKIIVKDILQQPNILSVDRTTDRNIIVNTESDSAKKASEQGSSTTDEKAAKRENKDTKPSTSFALADENSIKSENHENVQDSEPHTIATEAKKKLPESLNLVKETGEDKNRVVDDEVECTEEKIDISITASPESDNTIDVSEELLPSVEEKSDISIVASSELDISIEVEESSSEDVLEQVPPKIHETAANISKKLLEQALQAVFITSDNITTDRTKSNVNVDDGSSIKLEESSSKQDEESHSEHILEQASSSIDETEANISMELWKQVLLTAYKTSKSATDSTESNFLKEDKDSSLKEEVKQVLTMIGNKANTSVTSTSTETDITNAVEESSSKENLSPVDEIVDISVTDRTVSNISNDSDDAQTTTEENADIILKKVVEEAVIKVDEKADISETSTESDSSLKEVTEQVLPVTAEKAGTSSSKISKANAAVPCSSKTGEIDSFKKTKKKFLSRRYGFKLEYNYRLDLFEEFLENEMTARSELNEVNVSTEPSFNIAIWDQNPMDDVKVDTLRQALLVEAKQQFRYSNYRPKFDRLECKKNCLNVTCNNALTLDWVKGIIKRADFWDGIQLGIKDQEPPKPLPAILHAKLSEASTVENAINLLKNQNPELNVNEWKMYHSHCRTLESLQLIFFAIPESSLKVLEKTKHWVNFGRRKTYVQVYLENREMKVPIKPSKKPRLQGEVLCGFH